jgi:Tfp pilus assembly protein PilV
MSLFRGSKGISLVEVMIAIFLTTFSIMALFALQSPAWKTIGKADYLGRASEILHRQLESTEVYLMNQCNTAASAGTGIPVLPGVGGTGNATYTVRASGLGTATRGDASFTVTTSITAQTASYFRVTVTVTWAPLNPTGITQTIFVSRQQYFKNGC